MNYQSAIRGEALTLPSIEGGFGTLNIARDPPKAVFTRFKPKVSDTSQLTMMIDEATDRASEAILKYARGKNPMVSVSYSNYGTDGGQYRYGVGNSRDTAALSSSSASAAFLPYRVAREGAFRPPVIPPEQLLPLSRQPRPNTSQTANAGSSVTRRDDLTSCSVDLKALRSDLLRSYVASKPSRIIETPLTEPSDVQTNIRDRRNMVVDTNKTETKGTTASEFIGNQPIRTHARVQGKIRTNQSGIEANVLQHSNDIQLRRNLPAGTISTNMYQPSVDITNRIQGTDFYLPQRASRGGVENHGFRPSSYRQEGEVRLNDGKAIFRRAYDMQRSH